VAPVLCVCKAWLWDEVVGNGAFTRDAASCSSVLAPSVILMSLGKLAAPNGVCSLANFAFRLETPEEVRKESPAGLIGGVPLAWRTGQGGLSRGYPQPTTRPRCAARVRRTGPAALSGSSSSGLPPPDLPAETFLSCFWPHAAVYHMHYRPVLQPWGNLSADRPRATETY